MPEADHVFNTPNPMGEDAAPSTQLEQMLAAIVAFIGRVT